MIVNIKKIFYSLANANNGNYEETVGQLKKTILT